VRKNYYQEITPTQTGGTQPSNGAQTSKEDALIMWVHAIDTPDYAALLDSIERAIPGETVFEEPRR
jgi:hypothetical protein